MTPWTFKDSLLISIRFELPAMTIKESEATPALSELETAEATHNPQGKKDPLSVYVHVHVLVLVHVYVYVCMYVCMYVCNVW